MTKHPVFGSSRAARSALLALGAALVSPAPAHAQRLIAGADGDVDLGQLGISVASHGDADGDGVPDFVAGAPNTNYDYFDGTTHHHREGTGEVDFFSGATAMLHLRVTAGATGDDFGKVIAAIGDVSGDGVGDVLVSAPGWALFKVGYAVVLDGGNGSVLATIPGDLSAFGSATTALGDVDGDGVGDYAIGSPAPGVPTGKGNVFVYSGATATPLYTLPGGSSSRTFGASIARLPDVDGDGVDEVIVGDPNDDTNGAGAGAVWVFSGATGTQLLFVAPGPQYQSCGGSVLAERDLDGDGLADLVVGEPSGAYKMSGRIEWISSATGTVLRTVYGVGDDKLGSSLARLDDLNGDGVPELSVGAYEIRQGRQLRDGATGELLQWFGDHHVPRDFLAAIGDVDGDGRPDFVHGVPTESTATLNGCGRVEVLKADDLDLWSDLRFLHVGDTEGFHVRQGQPNQPVALFLVGVDGLPFTLLLGLASTDAQGAWDSGGFVVPAGTTTHEIELMAFSLESGRVAASWAEVIRTQ